MPTKKTTKEKAIKPYRYGVFDRGGGRYIRSYKKKEDAETFAGKPESKEGRAGYDIKKYPGQKREVRPLSKEAYQNYEAQKAKIDQEWRMKRQLSGKSYTVLKPKEFQGFK